MLNWSRAVTVTLKALPAVALAGVVTPKCVAAAAVTAIELLVPVTEALPVSVPVMVRLPAVLRVALKVPAPLVKMLSSGSVAPFGLDRDRVPRHGRLTCSPKTSCR